MNIQYETCSTCGYTAPKTNTYGQTIMAEYKNKMLCSSCRVDQRMKDGDYSND